MKINSSQLLQGCNEKHKKIQNFIITFQKSIITLKKKKTNHF